MLDAHHHPMYYVETKVLQCFLLWNYYWSVGKYDYTEILGPASHMNIEKTKQTEIICIWFKGAFSSNDSYESMEIPLFWHRVINLHKLLVLIHHTYKYKYSSNQPAEFNGSPP